MLLTGAHFYFMPKLIKISENEYRVSGRVEFTTEKVESVVVDGKRYSRAYDVLGTFDYDDEFKKTPRCFYWHKIEIDCFAFLGVPEITVWDYTGWIENSALYKLAKLSSKHYPISTNNFVAVICYLFDEKCFPSSILAVGTRKRYDYDTRKDQLRRVKYYLFVYGIIEIKLFEYGFQNSVFCNVDICNFLYLDMSNFKSDEYFAIQNLIPEILTTKKYMSDETRLIVSFRLFESQINFLENENSH